MRGGNCQILVKGVDITDNSEYNTHIAKINPFRYRGYYYDTETGFYYLNSRYYDPQVRRFINADDPSVPSGEQSTVFGGLNLYAYCLNNPVNMVDQNGNSPEWWQWLISGLSIIGGIILCFIPGTQGLGVSLFASGVSMLASNIMSAAGVGEKESSIVSSCLFFMIGIALCFTPCASIGASLIGSGVGSIAGGYISEALGGSFALGSSIGGMIGGIAGGKIYDAVKFSKIAQQ